MFVSEEVAEAAVREFVLQRAPLGIYNPMHPRRPRVAVAAFEVEFFEIEDGYAHAAGPVVLRDATGDVEKFLRVSFPWDGSGVISDDVAIRAVYVEETDPETGACKETAALANA